MLFDTHAHYDDAAFDPDRELLLESLPQRGVALVLNPGCDLDSSRKAVSYAAAFRWLMPFSCRSRLSVLEKSVAMFLSHPILSWLRGVSHPEIKYSL